MMHTVELTFGDMVRRFREEFFGQIIVYVYHLGEEVLFAILKLLNLST